MTPTLVIDQVHASVDGQEILKGISLEIRPGEMHAIMGRNGSGKSTLAHVLAGNPHYEITSGSIRYRGKPLEHLTPEERAQAGIFLSFQYPVVIPGVNNAYFLRTALNAVRKARGESEIDAVEFLQLAREKMGRLEMDKSYLNRAVNEGFSGGEKKRNEILQLLLLEPAFAILDETDSGLDIDALRIISAGVNSLRDSRRSFLVITHYQRLLNYMQPDVIHVMIDGKIVKTGGKELALTLEEQGYSWLETS
ncbi:MAG: Fe-S cluster assembly ATPase SufC [Candidatus Neomarinimicrobiota bacterium]|nr:MAG: Fe-S cluster assembly ATPase SufC [Candidatus Neomarinimicrobiota bacterium]